jgi:glycosyltransferase involved in cell wall biosynthesis
MPGTPEITVRRILMTADTVGGVWTYALELAHALQSYNIELVLATMGARLQEQQRTAVQQVKNITLVESAWKLEWMADAWDDVRAAGTWLLDLEALTQPDVVHLNGYAHGALPWQSPTLIVGHSCVCSWFAAVKGTAPPPDWERYRQEVRRGLHAADLVTAPTEAMLTALRTHYGGFRAAPAIANGRRMSQFPPLAKQPYILTAGRVWDEAKNIAALAQVAPQLSWPVFVAGEARHPEGGTVRFRTVQWLGPLASAELALWLGQAAIFALPARYEPFGLTVLEAGLAGCALVLGDIPSLREVWDSAALFVPPDQPDALAEVLEHLSRDVWWRDLMAQRARARALRYTPARMAHAYATLYKQMKGAGTPHQLAQTSIIERLSNISMGTA